MKPHYADDWLTVYLGDARAVMAEMEPESVNCVVTSPPYWGLRDYGVPGQLGLELTPDAYVEALVAVFREVRRVLRKDGTVWLNLGDTYARDPAKGGERSNGKQEYNPAIQSARRIQSESRGSSDGKVGRADRAPVRVGAGLKPKDRVMIPARVALALQADGWWLRDEIIWHKPNPMPSSVRDRTTPAHEMVYLLTRSARYWYDADAIREPSVGANVHDTTGSGYAAPGQTAQRGNRRDKQGALGKATYSGFNDRYVEHPVEGRNKRSVWTVPPQPYPQAHFATFPEALVEPMILAGCPEGGVVLDPFAGSGTTGLVAQRLSRRAVLIDLSMDYLGQLMDRNRDIPLGLTA
jgi:DNA modification methylase